MLKQRLLFGLPIAAGFAACMAFLPGPLLFLMLVAFTAACQWEFYELALCGGYRTHKRMGVALGILWLLAVYRFATPPGAGGELLPGWESALLIVIFLLVLLRSLADRKAVRAFETAAITLLGFLYLPLMLSYYLRLAQLEASSTWGVTRSGVFLCFYLSLVVKLSDTGAYACGTRWGRHKLWPRISPAKSWEGLAGGIVTGVVSGWLVAVIAGRYAWGPDGIFWSSGGRALLTPLWSGLVGLLLTLVGVLGDLIESMFKRAAQLKDSSCTIPGIGGILDVIDSLIFAPALLYFIVVWLA